MTPGLELLFNMIERNHAALPKEAGETIAHQSRHVEALLCVAQDASKEIVAPPAQACSNSDQSWPTSARVESTSAQTRHAPGRVGPKFAQQLGRVPEPYIGPHLINAIASAHGFASAPGIAAVHGVATSHGIAAAHEVFGSKLALTPSPELVDIGPRFVEIGPRLIPSQVWSTLLNSQMRHRPTPAQL